MREIVGRINLIITVISIKPLTEEAIKPAYGIQKLIKSRANPKRINGMSNDVSKFSIRIYSYCRKFFIIILCIFSVAFTFNHSIGATYILEMESNNDAQWTHSSTEPVKIDAEGSNNIGGQAVYRTYFYDGSYGQGYLTKAALIELDLSSIPQDESVKYATFYMHVVKVVQEYNYDNVLAKLSHYRSSGYTGDAEADSYSINGPSPEIESVFRFTSATTTGWKSFDVTSIIQNNISSGIQWAVFSLVPALWEDSTQIVGESKGISTASADYPDKTLAPYLIIETDSILDSDGDGISDSVENEGCTNPLDSDSDDDGIYDGIEDTNHNGIVDSGETDPCSEDSDGDGIQDGTEIGYTLSNISADTDTDVFIPDADPSTTTDPIDTDSDDDGYADGQEDLNYNGRVDGDETDPSINSNISPVALPDSFTIDEDNVLIIEDPGLLENDYDDDGDMITAILDTPPMHGTLVLNEDGSFTYTPFNNYNGGDSFCYHVKDSEFVSDFVIVELNVLAVNDAPICSAGEDQAGVAVGSEIELNGSGSNDPEGDMLTYIWEITQRPEGSVATLDDSTVVSPTYTVDRYGTYEIQLIVNDGLLDSIIDTVIVTTIDNNSPVAIIGAIQDANVGDVVCLDGSNSYDPDNDMLTFHWSLTVPETSAAQLNDINDASPCFSVDQPGRYSLTLTVSDGLLSDSSEEASINIETENERPVAVIQEITENQVVNVPVCLGGGASYDVDNQNLTFKWSIINQPEGSTAELDLPNLIQPCFTPDIVGLYQIQLIVNDGMADSIAETVLVTVTDQPVIVPNAYSCEDISAVGLICEIVELCHDVVTEGDKIIQTPRAGETVQLETTLILTISSGPCEPCIADGDCDLDHDQDGYTENQGDCDDSDDNVNPGEEELVYNARDDDCNPETLDDDLDLDGYDHFDDCDDGNSEINPGADDIPDDGIDQDCDGLDSQSMVTQGDDQENGDNGGNDGSGGGGCFIDSVK